MQHARFLNHMFEQFSSFAFIEVFKIKLERFYEKSVNVFIHLHHKHVYEFKLPYKIKFTNARYAILMHFFPFIVVKFYICAFNYKIKAFLKRRLYGQSFYKTNYLHTY